MGLIVLLPRKYHIGNNLAAYESALLLSFIWDLRHKAATGTIKIGLDIHT